MKVDFLQEPELEFGAGKHIDIKFGLMQYAPLDFESDLAPRQIRLGIVGTTQTIEGVQEWFERCRQEIDAKASNQPNLFPHFPGFNLSVGFRSSLVLNSQLQRPISQGNLLKVVKITHNPNRLIEDAVELFLTEIKYLVDYTSVDVIVCALPMELLNAMEEQGKPEDGEDVQAAAEKHLDFHHLLKARAMPLKKPIQLILPMTYSNSIRRKQKAKNTKMSQLQDEATRAWNIHTALYYKAGGVPWRLVRDPSLYTTCYVGVSFYRTLDGSRVMTSVAQVFNQRGEGVIVRGGAAIISKEDRQPHLEVADAEKLLSVALQRYREVHGNLPARVVVHKTSKYNEQEIEGFGSALEEERIAHFDFIHLGASSLKLFRGSLYPPLRGTLLTFDETTSVLYTRGSVDFFATYPGMYVPVPSLIRCERVSQTPKFLCQEILALTKMNWNNTQFDGSEPITIRAARQVSAVLKYVAEGDFIDPRYSTYM